AYLAFGSNLGDRAAAIAAALERLGALGVVLRARSQLYETDPVTPDLQPLFLNAAARVETALSARALLAACLEVERALGRRRPIDLAPAPFAPAPLAPAPREIDLDLLLYGSEVIAAGPALIVPHPRLIQRPFVRIPLADVAERGLSHPVTGEPLDRAAPDPAVRAIRDPL
ncbi:MAG TPA: 2-amino-4-hydroxy-6-hydroxymethyldihydropteridine diphosphokinase, partial [Polyangia bacterium]